MRSPYSVLGVRKDAGPHDIKAAYRRLAKTWHPDQNRDDPQAGDRFADIALAYHLLSDPELRSRFDRGQIDARGRKAAKPQRGFSMSAFAAFGEAWRTRPTRAPKDPPADAARRDDAGSAEAGFEDMLDHIFGEEARRRRVDDAPSMGENASAPAGESDPDPLSALDVLFERWKARGSRQARTPEHPSPEIEVVIDLSTAIVGGSVPVAYGDGLRGAVRVPALTADGELIEMTTEEGPDRCVRVRHRAPGGLRIIGADLHADHVVDLADAVLGGKVVLVLPDGQVRIDLPEWSDGRTPFVVPGRGCPRAAGGRGDLHVHLRIVLSEKPDGDLINEMRGRRKAWYV